MKKLEIFKNCISEKAVLDDNLLSKLNGGAGGPKITFSTCVESTCVENRSDLYSELVDDDGNYLMQLTQDSGGLCDIW